MDGASLLGSCVLWDFERNLAVKAGLAITSIEQLSIPATRAVSLRALVASWASPLVASGAGDALRARIASSYPQLGWLAPQTAAQVETLPAMVVTPTTAATPSPDYSEQLKTGLATVRESVNQIVASQQWMAGDIAKLQAGQQDILDKLSSTPPPPLATAAASKPTAAARVR